MDNLIISRQNKTIKFFKKLLEDKKYRDLNNKFVAETFRVNEALINSQLKCLDVMIENHCKHQSKYIDFCLKNNLHYNLIDSNVFNSVLLTENSDGFLALYEKSKLKINLKSNGHYLIIDHLQNPGNLGTIIRTANAFNIDGIFITNDSVDLYHPTTLRNSMGCNFNIPIVTNKNFFEVLNQLKQLEIKTYASCLKPSKFFVDNTKGIALVIGNEGNGLTKEQINACDYQINIPISDKVDSLNVAVAAGILMYKLFVSR